MTDKAKDRGRHAIRVGIGGEGPFLQHLKEGGEDEESYRCGDGERRSP